MAKRSDDIEREYEEALRDCPDADKIRAAFQKNKLHNKGRDERVRHDTIPIEAISIPVYSHPIAKIEPLDDPPQSRNWFLQALSHGNNNEILVAVYWARGLSLRNIAEKTHTSHDTIRRIIENLKERYS